MTSLEKPQKTIGEAVAEIQGIIAETMALGGNDSEFSILNELCEQVKKGEVSPDEGIARARAIQEQKTSNHH